MDGKDNVIAEIRLNTFEALGWYLGSQKVIDDVTNGLYDVHPDLLELDLPMVLECDDSGYVVKAVNYAYRRSSMN